MPSKYVRKTNNPNMGAPIKEIDFAVFEGLCEIQCTLAEIAGFFKVSEDTIERRCQEKYGQTFAETFKKYSSGGKISLRRTQFRMAETNPAMCIWLGKQYLGQVDRSQIEQSVNGTMATSSLDLSRLSVEKLRTMNALLKEASEKKD